MAACRSELSADDPAEHLALELDGNQTPLASYLAEHPSSQLFWFAPPQKQGQQDQRIRQFCQQLKPGQISRLVYISTTAVYGDCQGRWIDENEPLKPGTDRGRRRKDAEQCLQNSAKSLQFELIILRVPGIYGPGRWPLARLQKGLPVLRETESPYTNRIHQDDLALIAINAMTNAAVCAGTSRAYNVSDGKPSTMTDYFNRIADAFNLPRPQQVDRSEAEQKLTPAMLSFMNESKRLKTDRLLTELEAKLSYTSLSAGLAAASPPTSPVA